ncbi:MAG: hypothetical protein ABI321_01120 [Polyangia bacterium]
MSDSHLGAVIRRKAGVIAAGALVLVVIVTARLYRPSDAPFSPHDDSEVLERVPAGAAQSQVRRLEAKLARTPNDLGVATQLVRLHLATARRAGDARLLSYAEAALAPWWELPDPPPEALLLRATIEQMRHEFASALVDLDKLVALTPNDPQPWLTRASVLGVLSRYDEARASCEKLRGLTRAIVEVVCKARIDGVSGHAPEAVTALTSALTVREGDPAEVSRARSVRGEILLYAGDARAAEADLKAVVDADADDVYSRGLLSDLLLDAHREAEVMKLVSAEEVNEVVLLRRAIAAKRLQTADAAALSERLHASTESLRERGDVTRQREEARLLLEVDGDAARALPVAVASWKVQHEPWDARVLLESAAIVGDAAAAAPAAEWARATKCAWPPVVTALAKVTK